MKNGLRGHISEYVTIQIRAVKSRNGGNHVSDFSVHAYVKVGKSNFSKFLPVTFRQTPDMFSGVLKVLKPPAEVARRGAKHSLSSCSLVVQSNGVAWQRKWGWAGARVDETVNIFAKLD